MQKENLKETDDRPIEESKIKKYLQKTSPSKKIILAMTFIIIILLAILLILSSNKKGSRSISAKSSLEKIIEINELSTIDYTYNAIATKYKDGKNDKKSIEYYVAYEGVVTAGIDFNEIKIQIDDKDAIINIILPEVEIQDIRVAMDTMEYIFVKKAKEEQSISQEAYKLCKEDLKNRLENEENLYTSAKENAISAVEGLLKPWLNVIDKEYKVVIE